MPRKPNRKPSAKDERRISGDALRVIRSELRQMSQDDLAQAVKMNPSTITRYEKGTAYASREAMFALAAALRVPLDAISYPVHTVYVPVPAEDAEAVA
jgi:transcriptional regulator with XRE-family HTH domain